MWSAIARITIHMTIRVVINCTILIVIGPFPLQSITETLATLHDILCLYIGLFYWRANDYISIMLNANHTRKASKFR